MSAERWALWAPALIDAPIATSDEPLLYEALDQARLHAHRTFVTTARTQACQAETGWLMLRRLDSVLDHNEVPWLIELATDPKTPVATAREAFRQMIEVAPERAHRLLTTVLAPPDRDSEPERAQAFAAAALQSRPASIWPLTWPVISDDHEFAEQVLLEIAQSEAFDPTVLGEDQVIHMWELMDQIFPPETDPIHHDVHWVGPRESAAHLRDRLLPRLAERGTDQAVTALAVLSAAHPDQDWIARLAAQARRHAARNQWTPLKPNDLAVLLSAPHMSLVRTSADLLDVVREVMDQIQTQLTAGPTPEATMLWNHGRPAAGTGTIDATLNPKTT